MTQVLEPRICVVCRSAHNKGQLHGCWIAVTGDPATVYKKIFRMLENSPVSQAKEWMICDYDGFGSVNMEKYNDIDSICRIAAIILEHGELAVNLMEYYADIEQVEKELNQKYRGKWRSEMDFVMEYVNDLCCDKKIPDIIKNAIDFEKIKNDFFSEIYRSFKIGDKCHIFTRVI